MFSADLSTAPLFISPTVSLGEDTAGEDQLQGQAVTTSKPTRPPTKHHSAHFGIGWHPTAPLGVAWLYVAVAWSRLWWTLRQSFQWWNHRQRTLVAGYSKTNINEYGILAATGLPFSMAGSNSIFHAASIATASSTVSSPLTSLTSSTLPCSSIDSSRCTRP